MIEQSGDSSVVQPPAVLPLSPAARKIHRRIVSALETLLDLNLPSPLDPVFRTHYTQMLALFERFQQAIVTASGLRVTCTSGCGMCCFHWVEDVYSFEAEIIAAHLRDKFPNSIARIVALCRSDEEQLCRIEGIVAEKLAALGCSDEQADFDPIDLALSSFYQLRRPCALRADNGICSIYAVRPMTCRVYLSFSDRRFCDPDSINESDVKTYLCDVEQEAGDLLDRLHERYDRFEGMGGLRSLLYRYLEADAAV
jgi:Fe-S-cluster containining protein